MLILAVVFYYAEVDGIGFRPTIKTGSLKAHSNRQKAPSGRPAACPSPSCRPSRKVGEATARLPCFEIGEANNRYRNAGRRAFIQVPNYHQHCYSNEAALLGVAISMSLKRE